MNSLQSSSSGSCTTVIGKTVYRPVFTIIWAHDTTWILRERMTVTVPRRCFASDWKSNSFRVKVSRFWVIFNSWNGKEQELFIISEICVVLLFEKRQSAGLSFPSNTSMFYTLSRICSIKTRVLSKVQTTNLYFWILSAEAAMTVPSYLSVIEKFSAQEIKFHGLDCKTQTFLFTMRPCYPFISQVTSCK